MAVLTPPAGRAVWANPAVTAAGGVTVSVVGFGAHAVAEAAGASAQTSLLAAAITAGIPTLGGLFLFLLRRYFRRTTVREDTEWEVMQRLIEEHSVEIRRLRRQVEERDRLLERKDAEVDRLRRKIDRLETRKPRAAD